ncbi:MAG: PucR family transcriptional regulator ligand-binding domain-containing protein [Nocardioidaceae bacterium]
MAFTVADLLELPVMQAARVEVLTGSELAERRVRWVHTSEIYEIAPLLRGGEVLLTTGLGLVGHTAEAMSDYVRALARRGVAALMLELGRTFPHPPAPMVAAARDTGLPLIVLHGVVPFIQVTETVHPLLLDDELRQLRFTDRATAELHRAILAESGVSDLVALTQSLCDAPAGLFDEHGKLAAGSDVDRETALTVEVAGSPRMQLSVLTGPERRRLVELCASALAVCLAAERRRTGHRGTVAADLLSDLADESYYLTSVDTAARARSVGFAVRAEERALGLVVETTGSASAGVRAATTALREAFGTSLVGAVDGEVLAAVTTRPALLRARLEQAAESLNAELAATVGGRVVRLVAGPLVEDAAGLARSLPAAREAARLANTLVIESRVVLSNDLGVYRLLSSVVTDPELERFVNDQLGPLLELDARTGSELVPTLDAYLDAGLSKTAAAAALGIRRQTLYARLERIGHVLAGVDLSDRRRRTAVDLALVSWRLRTAAASYRR